MGGRRWTEEEKDILRTLYADPAVWPKDIAARLGRSLAQIYCMAQILGVKAPMERIRDASRIGANHELSKATRFKKGHVPATKGKKLSPEQYASAMRTAFKKGHVPHNHMEIGSERINGDGYREVKVAEPNKWRAKHRIVWEQHHGPIPPGYNIQFRNHDKLDCRIENLYMISRAEQMRTENGLTAKYPHEIQEIVRLRATVKRQITLHNRKKENGK